MRYPFPKIDTIQDVLPAIKDRKEFVVADRGDFLVINYLVSLEDTFPTPDTKDPELNRLYTLRRECRGLTFHKKSGKVAARKFHKFFNVNERPETSIQHIDVSQPHTILEKLDGSMLTPFVPDSGSLLDISSDDIQWHTKMGATDVAEPVNEFVKNNQHIARYAAHVMANNMTLLFEWCSRKNRIVIDHPVDRLVLTAIRHNVTGEYVSYDQLKIAETHGIEVVKQVPGSIENMQEFIDDSRELSGVEGFVIRFDDGHMVKVKVDEYVILHRAVAQLSQEKDVWRLILQKKDDDLKAVLADDLRDKFTQFTNDFHKEIGLLVEKIHWDVLAWKDNKGDSKKRFAVEFVNAKKSTVPERARGLYFQVFAGKDAHEAVTNFLINQTGSGTKVDAVRDLLNGIRWNPFKEE